MPFPFASVAGVAIGWPAAPLGALLDPVALLAAAELQSGGAVNRRERGEGKGESNKVNKSENGHVVRGDTSIGNTK